METMQSITSLASRALLGENGWRCGSTALATAYRRSHGDSASCGRHGGPNGTAWWGMA